MGGSSTKNIKKKKISNTDTSESGGKPFATDSARKPQKKETNKINSSSLENILPARRFRANQIVCSFYSRTCCIEGSKRK